MDYLEFKRKFNILLNQQQEAAVKKVQGAVLLLAVPGSGKTTVLVSRLGYMIYCCNIKPEEILVMTYTVAATQDMRQRFRAVFGDEYADRLEFRTINSVSNGIIRYYKWVYGRKAFELVNDEGFISKIIGDAYRKAVSNFVDDSDINDARTQITYIKNMRLSDEEIDSIKIGNVELAPIYRKYCQVMREKRLMDYDDQMIYAYNILQKYPNILSYFRNKYRHYCVDEAQDTSKIQHMIIRLLADESRNIFMVGDEDQSIYGFRAAYPKALIEFSQVYPESTCLLMEQNYRSTKQIVDKADKFIQKNTERHEKHMTTENLEGSPVKEMWVYDRKRQCEYIADVAEKCTTETAVLYRDKECALPIIDLLDRRGIKYRCKKDDITFFSHKIIRDITDYILFSYDPTDSERFLRIYYKFNAGISKAQAMVAADCAKSKNEPVFEHLLSLSSLSPWTIKQSKSLKTNFENMENETAERALYRIVNFMGYGEYLSEKNMDKGKIDILFSLASRVKTPNELLLRLDRLKEIVKKGSSDTDCPFILSTIHSSKGLEYENVILADVIDGICPKFEIDEASKNSEIPEEERRVFYVAMTRAKKNLEIIRFKKEGLKSSFADELFPPKTVKIENPKTKSYSKTIETKTIKSDLIKNKKQENIWAAKDFIVKTRVVHKKFGAGVITHKENDIVSIRFDNGAEKRFGLMASISLGIIRRLV